MLQMFNQWFALLIFFYLNPDPHACVIPLFVDDVTNQKIDRVANCGLITNNWNILFKLKIKVNGHKETKKINLDLRHMYFFLIHTCLYCA